MTEIDHFYFCLCLMCNQYALFIYAVTSSRHCLGFDGKSYNVGDVWKPTPNSQCSCTAELLIQCSSSFVFTLKPLKPTTVFRVCRDNEQRIRNPGDEWLNEPTTKCTCSRDKFVLCAILKEPVCMDSSGKIKKHQETWLKNDCIKCACINGSVNCTRYEVNVTYGLFEVKTYPICELCWHTFENDSSEDCKGEERNYHTKAFR